jgi:hypothetical protein
MKMAKWRRKPEESVEKINESEKYRCQSVIIQPMKEKYQYENNNYMQYLEMRKSHWLVSHAMAVCWPEKICV